MSKIEKYKNILLLGVGGIGMSALARFFNSKNKNVFGYDQHQTVITDELLSEGIEVFFDDDINFIPHVFQKNNTDNLVVYTPAININNSLLSFFNSKGFLVKKRSVVLGLISENFFTIAIAGTHGKTTTSALLTCLLKESNINITSFVGGLSRNYKSNFIHSKNQNNLNSSDVLVLEADEFDKSFLELYPDIAVITSIDNDHLDTYKNIDDIKSAFHKFSKQIKSGGSLVLEENISENFKDINHLNKYTYSSKKKSDVYAKKNIRIGSSIKFDIQLSNQAKKLLSQDIAYINDFILHMPGQHNLSNSLAAITVCMILKIDINKIVKSLNVFKGISRRFDVHIDSVKNVYIDDYAHHPKEIMMTLLTAKELFPKRKLTVVFQPHLYSRTKDFAQEFASSLNLAEELIITNIFPAREQPIIGVDSNMILDFCSNDKKQICDTSEVLDVLSKNKIDVLVTLGAGDISSLVEPIKHMLN
jgi:UDP-N-acetylmuramate--alanine ligase